MGLGCWGAMGYWGRGGGGWYIPKHSSHKSFENDENAVGRVRLSFSRNVCGKNTWHGLPKRRRQKGRRQMDHP